MRVRFSLLALILAVAVGFGLAYWGMGALDPQGGIAALPAQEHPVSGDPMGSSGRDVSVGGRILLEVAPVGGVETGDLRPTIRDAFEVLDQALGLDASAASDPDSLERKYAGASDAQILIAQLAASDKLERERTRIAEELMSAGEFTESIQMPGDPTPFPRATPERPIVSFAFHIEHGDGFEKVRTAEIDSQRFPEFHALEQEYLWLTQKAKSLKH